ncbi:MAG: hypothetical protein IJN80_08280 [Clostridia bacterium]|nr:hypothetical protein [Clostridia bacterium]
MIEYLKNIVDLTPYLGSKGYEGVRYNPKKIEREAFLKIAPFQVEQSSFYQEGFRITQGESDGNHPYHLAGLYYFQEPSAMSALTALQLEGHERVLDLCAAPGSKATAIGGALKEGLLVANEIDGKRAAVLRENLERMGIRRCVITQGEPQQMAKALPCYFDKVLIDSPCSGEGMFRKYPRILEEWSEELVAHCARRSRTVLEEGAKTLRAGGRLVYSTCTFNLEENERTILWFLERHPDFEVVETGLSSGAKGLLGLDRARRIFPQHGGEGHFVCAMVRKGEEAARPAPTFKAEKCQEPMDELKKVLRERVSGIGFCRGNYFYLADEDLPNPQGIRILRAGLQAMELAGRHWKPCHHLAMSLPQEAFRFAKECSLEEARLYVNGQVLPCEGQGFGVMAVEGVPLGLVKAAGGMGKNHFPKGLRTLK